MSCESSLSLSASAFDVTGWNGNGMMMNVLLLSTIASHLNMYELYVVLYVSGKRNVITATWGVILSLLIISIIETCKYHSDLVLGGGTFQKQKTSEAKNLCLKKNSDRK